LEQCHTETEQCLMVQYCRTLATAFDLGDFLSKTADLVLAHASSADDVIVLLYDDLRQRLTPLSASNCDERQIVGEIPVEPGSSPISRVFDAGDVYLFTDKEADQVARELFGPAAPWSAPPMFLSVPMAIQGTRIGCVLFSRRHPEMFSPRDTVLLREMVDILSLYVYKARTLEMGQKKRFSELVSTLSHELRTPLTYIKGYTTTMLSESDMWSAEACREFLEIIDSEADMMKKLLDDLMESSLIESGFLRIRKGPVLLPRLAHKAVEDAGLNSTKHRFVVVFPHDFPVIEADPNRIRQVLDNLLDNAVKYSPQGGLVVTQGSVEEKVVTISVSDEGIGVAPEHLNRLFEKFYRVKSDLAGIGLGLPVASEIIEKHGGRMWARSTPGKGSTFCFTLPITELSRRARGVELDKATQG